MRNLVRFKRMTFVIQAMKQGSLPTDLTRKDGEGHLVRVPLPSPPSRPDLAWGRSPQSGQDQDRTPPLPQQDQDRMCSPSSLVDRWIETYGNINYLPLPYVTKYVVGNNHILICNSLQARSGRRAGNATRRRWDLTVVTSSAVAEATTPPRSSASPNASASSTGAATSSVNSAKSGWMCTRARDLTQQHLPGLIVWGGCTDLPPNDILPLIPDTNEIRMIRRNLRCTNEIGWTDTATGATSIALKTNLAILCCILPNYFWKMKIYQDLPDSTWVIFTEHVRSTREGIFHLCLSVQMGGWRGTLAQVILSRGGERGYPGPGHPVWGRGGRGVFWFRWPYLLPPAWSGLSQKGWGLGRYCLVIVLCQHTHIT